MDARTVRTEVPLGATALGLIVGIGLASQVETGALTLCAACTAAVFRPSRPFALAVLAGVVLGAHPSAVRIPGVYEVESVVRHVGRPFRGRIGVSVDVEHVGGQERFARARIYAPFWAVQDWTPGTRVRAILRVRGVDDRGQWRAELPDVRAVQSVTPPPPDDGTLRSIRDAAAARFDLALATRNAALARAMILGDRSGVTREDRQLFRQTGQAHLLAVSGLHVGLWLIGLLMLLRMAGLGPRLQAAFALAALAIYVPLTGSPPSAVRAGCAVGVHFVGKLMGRPPAPLVVLGTVALGIFIVQPRATFEVAFQLSFGAVVGILLLTRPITAVLVAPRPVLPGFVTPKRAPIRRSLAVSLAAWMGTLPFVAGAIGQAAPAGPLVAVAAVPLTAVVLLTNMGVLALGWIPGLDAACSAGADLALDGLRGLLQSAEAAGVRALPIRAPNLVAVCAYGLGCATLARAQTRGQATRALLLCVGLVLCWWIGTPTTLSSVQRYHPQSVTATLPLMYVELHAPTVMAILALCLLGIGALSVYMRWLTVGGAACAVVLGLLAGRAFGLAGLAALFAPFLVATLLGKLPGAERAGARTPRQVLSNGLPAALGCVLTLAGHPFLGTGFFLGGLACLGSDSCATEIGVRYGGTPWSLTGAKVRAGESGGVTALGTAGALGGSLLAPLGWFAYVGFDGAWPAILTVATAGFAGSLLDSVLGASLQYRGRVPGTDRIVEQRHVNGVATERVRGLSVLDNDAVNLLTGLAAGAAAVALWHLGLGGVSA